MRDNDSTTERITKRDLLKAGAAGACALGVAGVFGLAKPSGAQTAQKGLIKRRRSPWAKALERRHVQCELCPRQCRLRPGQRGPCRVRENRGGRCYSLVFGNPCLVQIDPVERKPFFHVLPGSRALSVSTAGCNIECKFCEVWDMALVGPEDVHAYDLPPDAVVQHARSAGVQAVSFAFGEPAVFAEYALATAERAKRAGLAALLHTNGYLSREPLEALAEHLDAANVDLKGFDPAFYRDVCGGELAPVLDSLKRLKAAGVHLELTNILLPTLNDDMGKIREMCEWVAKELGPGTPLHFGRFYPLYKLANLPPTPVATLDRARRTAFDAGLEYVYVARVTGHEGESTYCPNCKEAVIQRLGFVVEEVKLKEGKCAHCGHPVPGRWEAPRS